MIQGIVCALATTALIAQSLPATPEAGLLGQAERLTLVGALVVAVWVLWRTNVRKDEQLILGTKAMTEALMASAESSRATAAATSDLRSAVAALRESFGNLPCAIVRPEVAERTRAVRA